MTAAGDPRARRGRERLLVVDAESGAIEASVLADLPGRLTPGDLLVVNDAATLPASLEGSARGAPIEVRLVAERDDGSWDAVLLGAGDHRTRTEHRPAPPSLAPGARVALGDGELAATVETVSALSPRLVALRFDGTRDALVAAIYRVGRPVQYAHVRAPLALGDVQTAYASRPWAAEMPSAGRPLTWELLGALRRRGVGLATLTHAAGLSATGDAAIDAALPLPERFEVPAATVAAVRGARGRGGRVVAVGTTVARALEGSAARNGGRLAAGPGTTDLRLGAGVERRVVDAILTGVHEPGTSHHALLAAFAPAALVQRALDVAEARGFAGHEFGDAMLVLGVRAAPDAGERPGRMGAVEAA